MVRLQGHLPELSLAEQVRMVDALQSLLQSRQPEFPVERIETHISFVLIDARFAYKLKKAVNPGFLDFSTRDLRHACCDAELRLNRRLAPDLYLDVVSVTGSVDRPAFGGDGPVIDHAVKMRAFPQHGLWDSLARSGELAAAQIDQLVDQLDRFHRGAPAAGVDSPFGTAAQVRAPMLDNLSVLRPLLAEEPEQRALDALSAWEATEYAAIEPLLQQRRAQGRVRECHGDLHLGNVVQIEGRCTVFDCIEFNDDFRWIDVISEVAFMAMDLLSHGCTGLAHRFVDAYLSRSGDYEGARLLRYFIVYRALVRAKVAALRAVQAAMSAADLARAVRPLLDLAMTQVPAGRPALLITHGFSGSGKTTGSQALLERLGAVRIRADVERKRLFGLDALARSGSDLGQGLYAAEATAATYQRLLQLAQPVLAGGFSVVLDATFGKHLQRQQAWQLAAQLGLPCWVLDFAVAVDTLRQRVAARAAQGGDASEADAAVLQAQIDSDEPLDEREQARALACPADRQPDDSAFNRSWQLLAQDLRQRMAAELRPGPTSSTASAVGQAAVALQQPVQAGVVAPALGLPALAQGAFVREAQ